MVCPMGIRLGFHSHLTHGHSLAGGAYDTQQQQQGKLTLTKTFKGQSPRRETEKKLRLRMRGNWEKLRKIVLVSTKAKYMLTLWCSHSIPQYILSERPTHVHQMTQSLRNSCVHKSPKWKPIQMLSTTTTTTTKQIHCEIVYCKEKVYYFTKCKKRKESQRYTFRKKKPDIKEYILYGSISIKFKTGKLIPGIRIRTVGCYWLRSLGNSWRC